MSATTKHLGFLIKNRGEYTASPETRYFKDNVVQYKDSSFICSPVDYDPVNNPYAYTTIAPLDSNSNLNEGWEVFAIGADTLAQQAIEEAKNQALNEINNAVQEYAPVQITGDVTNAADEEDITSVNVGGTDVLKLKDKSYNSLLFSGLGKTNLRKNIQEVTVEGVTTTKNILTQAMMNEANTIYKIQYDYDLNGAEITIPEDCVLRFEGGSLRNGSIVGNNTSFSNCHKECLLVDFGGSFRNMTLDASWLGLIPEGDGSFNGTTNQMDKFKKLNSLINSTEEIIVEFAPGYYGYGGETFQTPPYPHNGSFLYGEYAILIEDYGIIPSKCKYLKIRGNSAVFINVFEYHIGGWSYSNGVYTKVKSSDSSTRTNEGGFICVRKKQRIDVELENFTQNHNAKQMNFGGQNSSTQAQIGIEYHSCGFFHCTNINANNNITDGIRVSFALSAGITYIPIQAVLENCTMDNNYRLGLTIEGGWDIKVIGCIFKNCGQIYEIGVGTNTPYTFEHPYSAIDIEPMSDRYTVGTVFISNCTFENINRYCIVSRDQKIDSVIIDNCKLKNDEIEGNVRNTTRGKHMPCLSYRKTEDEHYGEVYETCSEYNEGVEITRFVNINSGKKGVSVTNCVVENAYFGGAYVSDFPTSDYIPEDFDPSDTSAEYIFLKTPPAPTIIDNILIKCRRIWEDVNRTVTGFLVSFVPYNYRYRYSNSTWSWEKITGNNTTNLNGLFYYHYPTKNVTFETDGSFTIGGATAAAYGRHIDNFVLHITGCINQNIFPNPVNCIIDKLTIIDDNNTNVETSVNQSSILLKRCTKVSYVKIGQSIGIKFSQTSDYSITTSGNNIYKPLEGVSFIKMSNSYNPAYLGFMSSTVFDSIEDYARIIRFRDVNSDVAGANRHYGVCVGYAGSKESNTFFGSLKGYDRTSAPNFDAIKNTELLYKGEIILDLATNNLIIGKGSNSSFLAYDGADYEASRSGNFADKPNASKIYVGFKYFCTDKQSPEQAAIDPSVYGIEIIHKGNNVWVDALGRVVS